MIEWLYKQKAGVYMISRSKKSKNESYAMTVMDNPLAVLAVAVMCIILGIVFIVSQTDNKPISRNDAVSYSGSFDHYDTAWKNYREIHFEDGSVYEVYPHTESSEFRERMESLEKGTRLHILVNPNNDYVAEVRTDTEELLNFEASQRELDAYDNGYVVLGIILIAAGVLLIAYVIGSTVDKKKEAERHAARKAKGNAPLRHADLSVRGRILLEADVNEYQICYRRVKTVNELIVNGQVYDEKKGLIEYAHKLYATVDGHKIQAGYDNKSNSYIKFDGQIIQRKKRLI